MRVEIGPDGTPDFMEAAANCTHNMLSDFFNNSHHMRSSVPGSNNFPLCLTETERFCLLRVVCLVSSLPATSATSERVFSASGLLNGPRRAHMRPAILEMLTVLRFELKWQLMLGEEQMKTFMEDICNKLLVSTVFDE